MQLHVADRAYTSWTWSDPVTGETVDGYRGPDPGDARLFHGDCVAPDGSRVSSPVRARELAGVLVLEGDRMYGRSPHNGKPYYQCVPDDKHLPVFLVPYERKQLGFGKHVRNLYCTFCVADWTATQKHPTGSLRQVLGPVDDDVAYSDYLLYCHDLHGRGAAWQAFTKEAERALVRSGGAVEAVLQHRGAEVVEDRSNSNSSHPPVFSMDPAGTVDVDDAWSFEELGGGNLRITIYLAHVAAVLDALQLWPALEATERVSSIYLPDRKRPMLPPLLSQACSLQAGACRVALAWDTVWDVTTGQRVHADVDAKVDTWRTVIVRVERNHVYESPTLLSDPHYQRFAALTKRFDNNNEVHNSLDVVRWWMVQANHAAGDTLRHSAVPALFRSAPVARPLPALHAVAVAAAVLPPWWNTSAGVLSPAPPPTASASEVYAPVTSPLRRIVDLVNSALLTNTDMDAWRWTEATTLARLRTTLRDIRRVESDAALWHLCRQRVAQGHTDLDGYVLACEDETDDKHKQKHLLITLYLPDLKHVTSVRLPQPLSLSLPLSPTLTRWRLFLFDDAVRLRQKLRLSPVLQSPPPAASHTPLDSGFG